eukprot:761288_1
MQPMQEHSLFFFFESKKPKSKSKSKQKAKQLKMQSLPNIFTKKGTITRHKGQSYIKAYTPRPLPTKKKPIKTDLKDLECNKPRAVFLDLFSLHKCWRSIPSNILFDSLIILPNIYIEWILTPSQYNNNIPQHISVILSDIVFLKLLQWKHQQSLLFCMLNTKKTITKWNLPKHKYPNIAPFWQHLNHKLCEINDPLTYKTTSYNPLIFNLKFYTNELLYESKYDVDPSDLISELATCTIRSYNIIAEIFYQSNPYLNIITSYSDIKNTILSQKSDENLQNSLEQLDNNELNISPISPITPSIDNDEPDLDSLLDDIIDTLSIESDDEENNYEMSFETNKDWWFAEAYEN